MGVVAQCTKCGGKFGSTGQFMEHECVAGARRRMGTPEGRVELLRALRLSGGCSERYYEREVLKCLPRPCVAAPVTDLESGKAYVRGLLDNGLFYHLEDDPDDIESTVDGLPLFYPDETPALRARVRSLYELDWGKYYVCAIGYALEEIKLREANGAPDASVVEYAVGADGAPVKIKRGTKMTKAKVQSSLMQLALDFNGMVDWKQIVAHFEAVGAAVRDWEKEIRGPLQGLIDDGTFVREPDVRAERYLMLSHATARGYYESKYPSPADPGRKRGETKVAKKKATKKAKATKAKGPKKEAAARAPREGTVAEAVREAIAAGGTNAEVAAKLSKKHPSVTNKYVAWYRWKAKKDGANATH